MRPAPRSRGFVPDRKTIRMNQKFIWIFVATLLLVIVAIWSANRQVQKNADSPGKSSRQIRYSFTVKNTTNSTAEDVSLWTYAPVGKTARQTLKTIKSSHPYHLTRDCYGNRVLYFPLENIAPFASKIITVKTDLLITQKPAKTACPDGCREFLQQEFRVQSRHPAIKARASSLKRADRLATAEAIYKWVSSHMEYSGYVKQQQGALYALTRGTGDCTEYMDLFAALCRAAGIPCRRVGGYICERNTVLQPSGYHNWAEIYVNGQWRVADPWNRVFMEKDSVYIALHIIGDQCANPMKNHNLFRVCGQGIKAEMNS